MRSPSWLARLAIALLAVEALPAVLCTTPDCYWVFLFRYGIHLLLAVGVLASVRASGMELVDAGRMQPIPASPHSGIRITIRDMLLLTAALSVLAAVPIYVPFSSSRRDVADVAIFASWQAAVTVTAAIAGLAFNRVVLPAILPVAVAAGCGYALGKLLNVPISPWYFVSLTTIDVAVQLVALFGYRRLGIRLKRHRRTSSASLSEPRQGAERNTPAGGLVIRSLTRRTS